MPPTIAPSTMSPEEMRELRKRLQLRQQDLADRLGLSKRAIAYYELGQRPIPKVVALASRALEAGLG